LFEERENLANIRRELILDFLRKYHPSSVTELKSRLANEGVRSSDEDLLNIIRELQRDGDIRLLIPVSLDSFPRFLSDTSNSWWIYATVLISLAEIFLVRYNVQDPFFGGIRLLFGLGLLGFLPGYATVQVLFPRDQVSLLERILLSIFLSVIVSIALGVSLGAGYLFTPMSGVLLSSTYAIVASILAGYRRYSSLRFSR
jgi:hypothetical protein